MEVTNEAGARQLVHSWVSHREAERRKLGLSLRPLPDLVDRFTRWASDQDGCARMCRNAGQPTAAGGHAEAAAVLRAAALDAATEVSDG